VILIGVGSVIVTSAPWQNRATWLLSARPG